MITAVHSGKAVDVCNWSLDNAGNIFVWDKTFGENQQWYLEYAEDGWFYIRSRYNAKCLTISRTSTSAGTNIYQWDNNNWKNQQWRFLPVGAPVEFTAPDAPTSLVVTFNTSPIHLTWDASSSSDVAGYTIFRAEKEGEYNTIARNVTSTSYDDNTAVSGRQYYYKINAVDHSLNRSTCSNAAGSGIDNSPSDWVLEQNYPNPFNSETNITFRVPVSTRINLSVFDVNGRLIQTLLNKNVSEGVHPLIWNASGLSSGVYFIQLSSKKFSAAKKCILMK
jgi:hypothetical protein